MEEGQGGGGGGGEGDDHKAKPEPLLGFTKALNAFETMTAFMHAHYITETGHTDIIGIESLLFYLKRKGATKQMKISDSVNTYR
jgi:hypothetical protein